MRLNKNRASVVAVGVCLLVWGTFHTPGYADEITPTPTWVWRSHPSKLAIETLKKATPTAADISGEGEDYSGKESEQEEIIKRGHVTGTPLTAATMKPEPDPPANLKIKIGDGMAKLTWDASPRAIGYVIYVSEDGKKFKRRFQKPLKAHEITIGVLENGKTYYFGVEGVGPYGRSTKMTVQTVVPKKGTVMSKEVVKPQSFLIGRELCA